MVTFRAPNDTPSPRSSTRSPAEAAERGAELGLLEPVVWGEW